MATEAGKPTYLAVCIRDPRNELIPAECENLTGGIPDQYGVARCSDVKRVPQACYIRTGLRLITEADSLESPIERVGQTEFKDEGFRIELFRLSKQVKIDRWEAMRRVANAIPYHPDMKSPKHRFLILARDGWYCLGEILTEQMHDYRRHDAKKWRTSSSLPSQLARALVNLVVPGCEDDPGSLLRRRIGVTRSMLPRYRGVWRRSQPQDGGYVAG